VNTIFENPYIFVVKHIYDRSW